MRHPVEDREFTPIEVALWRLRVVTLEIQELTWGTLKLIDVGAENSHLWFTLNNHGLLLVAKFLEIWDDFGSLAKLDSRVVLARRAAAPLVNRILVWEGLRDHRNSVGAHAYLDKSGNLVTPWDQIARKRAPGYHAEVILLLNITLATVDVVLQVFASEYLPLRSTFAPTQPPPGRAAGIELGHEIAAALETIVHPAFRALDSYNIPVNSSIHRELSASPAP